MRKIKVFQIEDPAKAFFDYDAMIKKNGKIDRKEYTEVYSGQIGASGSEESLEDIFTILNTFHPEGYHARSLSVSDVVGVFDPKKGEDGYSFYFVDSFGFKRLSGFDRKTQIKKHPAEEELAKAITAELNALTFDYKTFNESMAKQHRTLQQSFTRLCVEWIRCCADFDDAQIDGRNEASVAACKVMREALDDKFGGNIPMI